VLNARNNIESETQTHYINTKKKKNQLTLVNYSRVEMIQFLTFYIFLLSTVHVTEAQMYWQKLFDSLSYKQNYKPAPRRDAAIGHDIARNRVIVFGGWQTNAQDLDSVSVYNMPVLFDDTWEFNLDTSSVLYSNLILVIP
jgi:hypothetical protein